MRLINADDVKELLLGLDSLPWEEQVDELVDAIPTVQIVNGREYVSKYGSCPMCTDCPDGCPLDK